MKRASFLIIFALFSVLLPMTVNAQTPGMPDYSQWKITNEGMLPVAINGKTTTLHGQLYQDQVDIANLKRYTVVLFYNDKNVLWFSLVTEEVGEKQPNGAIFTKETHYYIFESVNSKWVLAKDLTNSPNPGNEADNFVKTKFGVEFK